MTNSVEDAVEDLKYFVAGFFDGSLQRCMELDELLWQVRLAKSHREPRMLHYEAEGSTDLSSFSPKVEYTDRPPKAAIPNLEDI